MRFRILALVFLGYALATVVLTWPLARRAGESLAASLAPFDTLHIGWALAYETHALATEPTALAGGNIYHPTAHSLFYGPTSFGSLPIFAPLYLASGNPALAINGMFLLNCLLTAAGLHLVAHRFSGLHSAGVVAGFAYLTRPWMTRSYGPAIPHYSTLEYLPWIFLLCAGRLEGRWRVPLLGVLIALQCLVEPVYVAPAVSIGAGILCAWRLARARDRDAGVRLGVALAIAGILMLPVFAGYLGVFRSDPHLAERTAWKVPPEVGFERTLWLSLFSESAPSPIGPVLLVLVALAAVALIVARRSADHPPALVAGFSQAAYWSGIGIVFSAGRFEVGGVLLPLPMAILASIVPALSRIRRLDRLGVIVLVAGSLLAALAFALVFHALRRSRLSRWDTPVVRAAAACAVVAALVGESPSILDSRLRLNAAPRVPEEFLPVLRGGREPLLTIPIHAVRSRDDVGLLRNARAEYQSTFHWRPILNGYASYYPAGFAERMKLAARLPDREALEALVGETGLGMIWVNTAGMPPSRRKEWTDLSLRDPSESGLALAARADGALLFAVQPLAR